MPAPDTDLIRGSTLGEGAAVDDRHATVHALVIDDVERIRGCAATYVPALASAALAIPAVAIAAGMVDPTAGAVGKTSSAD